MKKKTAIVALAAGVVGLASGLGAGLVSQPSAKAYKNGSVWEVQFVRMKPGMDDAYKNYLSGQWRSVNEALKKDGLILSYKVLECEAHGKDDFNLMLMTEYKDLASMEEGEPRMEAVEERVVGNQAKQESGYKERGEIRELIGSRLSREIVLEGKR